MIANLCRTPDSFADGVYRDGAGARAMALGGASVGSPDEPLEAMYSNPAGLAFAKDARLQLGAIGGVLGGNFSNSSNPKINLHDGSGALPEAAYVLPLKPGSLSLGLGFIPEAFAAPDWQFVDKPGGLGGSTSYGQQRNYSAFLAARASAGLSWKITDTLALGADLGAEYNRNELVTPYTFQNSPALKGFKTLLNLRTDGWGVNGTVGLVWHAVENLSLGLSYRSTTFFDTEGDASGNAGLQLQALGAGAFRPDFHYDAEVATRLPQMVSAGFSWQARDWLRIVGETDWINWSGAFDHLDIKLKNGNNADINGFLASNHIQDVVPLNWKDAFVYRLGLEFALSDEYTARLGYTFGANPVPSSTITPMSAAILEHSLASGLEWRRGRYTIAGAYQYSFPATSHVDTSSLASGEYSNSTTTLQAHWFGVTLGVGF